VPNGIFSPTRFWVQITPELHKMEKKSNYTRITPSKCNKKQVKNQITPELHTKKSTNSRLFYGFSKIFSDTFENK